MSSIKVSLTTPSVSSIAGSFEEKKDFLMKLLDKNLLYVNYCDMDDEEYGISDEDKAFISVKSSI